MRVEDVLTGIPGLTYRRLDYWIRLGLVHTTPRSPGEGSGFPRDIPDVEVAVLRILTPLATAGVKPVTAETLARRIIRDGRATLGGLILTRAGES